MMPRYSCSTCPEFRQQRTTKGPIVENPRFTPMAALIGRILIALIFVLSGFSKIGGFSGVVGYIGSKGLPMPEVLAALTIALELGGGLLLMIGFKTRWVALLFFLWLIPTTLVFHRFWGI